LVAHGDEVAVNEAWIDIAGDAASGMLLIGDHASSHVPGGIDLGVSTELMGQHVAIDIGVAPLGEALCVALGCPGVLGGVSRLVIDLNREEDAPGLIPEASDGNPIPANVGLSAQNRAARVGQYWAPYHGRIEEIIEANRPKLLISLHSFTPRLATSDEARPWQIGILYNQDERAARIALPLLTQRGIVAGDNLPYSGKALNATMNRHGEGNGIAYLGIEVRQDLIGDAVGVARWCERLAPVIATTLAGLGG
jgi:predicted N-formylglutamate amidohydrolase